MDLLEIANKLSGAGLATVLILILLTGWKGVWIFATQSKEMIGLLTQQRDQLMKERDAWQQLALRSTVTADKAVEHASIVQKGAA